MGNPFTYSKAVSGNDLIKQHIPLDSFKNGIIKKKHTLVQAPYGWGKTSFVNEGIDQLTQEDDSLLACWVDCLPFRTEQSFYQSLVRKVAQTLAGSEPWHQIASTFLQQSNTPFSFRMQKDSYVLELFDIDRHYAEILELIQSMAENYTTHLVLCLDNFENVDNFHDPSLLTQRIRSVWQHHQNATYCFIARPRDFIESLFESNIASFHSFGNAIKVTKPEPSTFADYIQRKFHRSGKSLELKQAMAIVSHMGSHPYHVQQLAYTIWEMSGDKVLGSTIIHGLETMLAQQAILYNRILGELSNSQFNFLKALASGIQKGFSKQNVISTFELGSSANVVKIQKALIKKEVIQMIKSEYRFLDPAFALWFKWNILK